jgi:IclR family pca regulon transcriptional regulator
VSEAPERNGVFVQSLARGLDVIRALGEPAAATLSDVARATGLSRASARRSLLTLERLGYVAESAGRYRLTAQVLELGYAYLSSLTLPELAQPHLEQLAETVHESSSISVLDGDDIVYVARVPTRGIMTVAISVGTRFPAYATSMGRVLLAYLPDDELETFLTAADFAPLTPATLTRPAQLRQELERVRRQGWALVDQELEAGLRSLAAPIHDRGGGVVAAVNVSAHAGRTTLEQLRRDVLPRLRATARRIERDLGYQPAA